MPASTITPIEMAEFLKKDISFLVNTGIDVPGEKPAFSMFARVQADQITPVLTQYSGMRPAVRRNGPTAPISLNSSEFVARATYNYKRYASGLLIDESVLRHPAFQLNGYIQKQRALFSAAVMQTDEILAADALIRAFTGASDPLTTPDGVALFGSHVRKGGETINNFSTSPLSYTALQDALTTLMSNIGDTGQPFYSKVTSYQLTVGVNLMFTASEIINSIGGIRPDTLNPGAPNAIQKFISGIQVIKHFNSAITAGSGDIWILSPSNVSQSNLKLLDFSNGWLVTTGTDINTNTSRVNMERLYTQIATHDSDLYGANPV